MQKLAIYRRLFAYLRPYRKQALIAYGSMFLTMIIGLFIPQIIKLAIDEGLAAGQPVALFAAGGVILAVSAVRAIVAFGQRYYGLWLTHRVAYDLRNQFYERVQSLPFAFHDRAQTGDLMSRATGDITETEQFVGMGGLDLAGILVLIVGVLSAMFLESTYLSMLALLPMGVLILGAILFGTTVRPLFTKIQEQMGVLSTTMQESMTGIQVVKAFAREPFEFKKFDSDNETWFRRRYDLIKIWGNFWPFFTFLVALAIFLILWFGGPMALRGEITIGSLFVMTSYVLMLSGPVQRVGFLVNLAATASASASRVFEIIDTPSEIVPPTEPKQPEVVQGAVTFRDISFAYQGKHRALHEVNFQIEPGQKIALIGPTGSGKSTIINLIPRFYDPLEGQILVDNIDVREWDLALLRRNIGMVLQSPFLFSASIHENIAYGQVDASEEAVIAAAKAARAHDFIMQFPDGYDTHVGERGVTLSGGQKQRVAIARALLTDPRILILDDSTSSVDTETEHLIQEALVTLMEGRTTFIIAQRLLTLKSADLILVLDQGRIVERGTHDALLMQNGLYRQIYDLQLRDQESFVKLQQQDQVHIRAKVETGGAS